MIFNGMVIIITSIIAVLIFFFVRGFAAKVIEWTTQAIKRELEPYMVFDETIKELTISTHIAPLTLEEQILKFIPIAAIFHYLLTLDRHTDIMFVLTGDYLFIIPVKWHISWYKAISVQHIQKISIHNISRLEYEANKHQLLLDLPEQIYTYQIESLYYDNAKGMAKLFSRLKSGERYKRSGGIRLC